MGIAGIASPKGNQTFNQGWSNYNFGHMHHAPKGIILGKARILKCVAGIPHSILPSLPRLLTHDIHNESKTRNAEHVGFHRLEITLHFQHTRHSRLFKTWQCCEASACRVRNLRFLKHLGQPELTSATRSFASFCQNFLCSKSQTDMGLSWNIFEAKRSPIQRSRACVVGHGESVRLNGVLRFGEPQASDVTPFASHIRCKKRAPNPNLQLLKATPSSKVH